MRFFPDFRDFGWILGSPGGSGGLQKSIKNKKNRVWEAFNARQRVRLVFGRFWKGWGKVLGRFLEGFGNHFIEKIMIILAKFWNSVWKAFGMKL